jgi:hypothetical protein
MSFNENQKSIFKQLTNFSEPLFFLPLLTKHFLEKDTIVEYNKDQRQLVIPDTMGLNNYQEIKDLLNIWIYAQDNHLVYFENYKENNTALYIYFKPNGLNYQPPGLPKPDLTLLLSPFWTTKIWPTFALYDFINYGYKTKEEIRLDEEREARKKEREINETRLNEERQERIRADKARRTANWLTIFAVVISAILGLLNTYKAFSKDDNVVRIKSFPDNVKVMYYNPPIDTGYKK